jgi:hypothetical protein
MRLTFTALALVVSLAPSILSAGEFSYRGICDASAAVALDADHFVVADDEKNTLRIYRRGQEAKAKKVSLEDYLEAKESDIEGAARIGNLIYWIGSHSKNKKKRRRLFATRIVDGSDGLTVEQLSSPPYTKLVRDLLNEPKFAALKFSKSVEKEDPEEEGAFNIEGLAATPEGHLLIGFRNPLKDDKAIVIPITNPQAVVERGKKPEFGDAITVTLGRRGIRSIERIGDRYLIIAGPFDGGKRDGKDFALYAWSGKAGDKPDKIRTDFGTLIPEAIFAIPGGNEVQILSDDGKVEVAGGDICKDVPKKKKSFRSVSLPLP